MAVNYQVTFDCADPAKLSEFWATALSYRLDDPPKGFASWPEFLKSANVPEERWNDASAIIDPDNKDSRIFFQKVPEGKTAKNRLHLDVRVGGPRGTPPDERKQSIYLEAERLEKLGATHLKDHEVGGEFAEFWVVMQDPEGNEFCLT